MKPERSGRVQSWRRASDGAFRWGGDLSTSDAPMKDAPMKDAPMIHLMRGLRRRHSDLAAGRTAQHATPRPQQQQRTRAENAESGAARGDMSDGFGLRPDVCLDSESAHMARRISYETCRRDGGAAPGTAAAASTRRGARKTAAKRREEMHMRRWTERRRRRAAEGGARRRGGGGGEEERGESGEWAGWESHARTIVVGLESRIPRNKTTFLKPHSHSEARGTRGARHGRRARRRAGEGTCGDGQWWRPALHATDIFLSKG